MHKTAAAALAAAALALPLAARADVGVRIGLEAPMVDHYSSNGVSGTNTIADSFDPAFDAMVRIILPTSILSIDGEFSEGLKSPNTSLVRLGVTLSPPLLPIYVRGAIPLRFNPSPFLAGLRLAGGITIPLVLLSLYAEAGVDFPLFGGSGTPNAFAEQSIYLGAGGQVRF